MMINNLNVRKNDFSTDIFLHSINVANISKDIATWLQLNKEDIFLIYNLALLHDIGKSNIPKDILYKKGKLNEKEWIIMKNHPYYSVDLILEDERYNFIHPYMEVIQCHHESWNGTGYPNKLKRHEIPLWSRIITIADIFDAVSTPRIYRPYSIDPIKILDEEKNIKIDPYIYNDIRKYIIEDVLSKKHFAKSTNL